MTSMPLSVVITCEHARCGVPPELDGLGLSAETLRSHVSWDPGALDAAEVVAERLGLPLLAGGWSRLVTDLNRHPEGVESVPRVAFGVTVPGNDLDADARAARLARYHEPYWAEATSRVASALSGPHPVLHLSVHSFDPEYGDEPRPWDVGVLADLDTPFEGPLARQLCAKLTEGGLHAGLNVPYDGRSDYLVTHLRSRHPARRYAGIMVELSQRHVDQARAFGERLARLIATLKPEAEEIAP